MRRFLCFLGRSLSRDVGLLACVLLAVGATFVSAVTTPIWAQTMGSPLQQLLGGVGGRGSSSSFGQSTDDSNSTVLMQPGPRPSRPLPRSAVEQVLSARAGTPLNQFGYAEMGVARPVLLPQSGGVQDNYILGPGDEIVVTLRGQEANEFRTFVDRSGRVILPKLSPINVAGRSFSDFQQDLTAAVQRAYVATEAFVALGRIRQIRVTVGGEVNNPGLRIMTGLASAVDAIFVSNGVKKTGSLRNIHILRAGQRIRVDLYGILRGTAGAQPPLLTDGDRLIVNSLGATVAIAGPVRVPGIYELAPGQSSIAASTLIDMAGGYVVRGRYDLGLIGLAADGRTQLTGLANDKAQVRDSDVLIVRTTAEQTVGRATLQAGSDNSFTGTYATPSTRLSGMLRSPGMMGDDPYPLFAIISRRDPTTLVRTLVPVTPAAVLLGRQDYTQLSDDIIHTFSRTEALNLINAINWFDDRRKKNAEKGTLDSAIPLLGRPEDLPPAPPRPRNGNSDRSADTGSSSQELLEQQRLNDYNDTYVRTSGGAQYGAPTFNSSEGYNDGTGYSVAPGYNSGFDSSGENTSAGLTSSDDPRIHDESSEPGVTSEAPMVSSTGPNSQTYRIPVRPDPAGRYRRELARVQRVAEVLKVEAAIIANFLLDHRVTLVGAVHGPGRYFVGPDLPLGTLVQAAGGTLNWSDRTGVERVSTVVDASSGRARTSTQVLDLTQQQFANAIVRPGDQFRFPQAVLSTIGTIVLKGEVRRPGVYSVVRGERLSNVLIRAGGLTSTAYPYGSVFLRKSVAEREKEGLERAAADLENQLTVALTRTNNSASIVNPALTYESIQGLVNSVRNSPALGRITVMADPVLLATNPGRDPLLEDGDSLFIPARPTEVTVIGEVMNRSSFASDPNMSVEDYIGRSGGYGRNADTGLTFVVLPDGTSRKVERSFLSMGEAKLPPGSVIVVPRDVNPFNLRQTTLDITQILSQVAITAASLAVLSR